MIGRIIHSIVDYFKTNDRYFNLISLLIGLLVGYLISRTTEINKLEDIFKNNLRAADIIRDSEPKKALEIYENIISNSSEFDLSEIYTQAVYGAALCNEELSNYSFNKSNLLKAEKYFITAIDLFSKVEDSLKIAFCQYKLAKTFLKEAEMSNRNENINNAMDSNEKALSYFMNHNNSKMFVLSNIVKARILLNLSVIKDRKKNISKALKVLEDAEIIAMKFSLLYELGNIYKQLGVTYQNLALFNSKDLKYLNKSIEFLDKSIKTNTIVKYPKEFANAQYEMARSKALKYDIDFESSQLPEIKLHLSLAQDIFSNLYEFPIDYSKITELKSVILLRESQLHYDKEKLDKAKQFLLENLKSLKKEEVPLAYSGLQYRLAYIYLDLALHENPMIYLDSARQLLQNSLLIRDFENHPYAYAHNNNLLGVCYIQMTAHNDPVISAKEGIIAFNNALRVFNKEDFFIDYAMVNLNLGGLYMNLAEELDTTKNALLAIQYEKNAMECYPENTNPYQYNSTKLNLAFCYSLLGNIRNEKKYLDTTLIYANEVLKYSNKAKNYELTAKGLMLIGLGYYSLSKFHKRIESLNKSISYLKQCQNIWSKNRNGTYYSYLNYCIGRDYYYLARIKKSTQLKSSAMKYIDSAIDYFETLNSEKPLKEMNAYKDSVNNLIF